MIFDLFRSKPKRLVGVDIGTASIKVAELGYEQGRARLTNYGVLENYGALSPSLLDQEVAEMLAAILAEAKMTTTQVVMAIPVFSSFLTVMELPSIPEKEIREAVPFEAKQYIPVPVSEVVLDWSVLPSPASSMASANVAVAEKIHVLLVAIPKEVIHKYQQIARFAKLKLSVLEVETFGLVRALVGNDPSTLLLLDIGARSSTLSIVSGGVIHLSRSLETAGADFTKTVSQGLSLATSRAEGVKKEEGLRTLRGEGSDVKGLLLPLLDSLIEEVERIREGFEKRGGKAPEKAIVAGGSAQLPGLLEYFVERLGIEVSRANPFARVLTPEGLEPVLKESGPALAVAVGMAMYGH